MFPKGVGAYVDLMQDLIPEMTDGTVRTAIDTGCGVSHIFLFLLTFSCSQLFKVSILLKVNALTFSVALRYCSLNYSLISMETYF